MAASSDGKGWRPLPPWMTSDAFKVPSGKGTNGKGSTLDSSSAFEFERSGKIVKLSFSVFAPMAGIAIVVTASANILALIPQVSATLSNYETKSSTLPVLAAITPVPVHHASSMTETIRSPVPLLLSRHPAVGSTGAAFEEFPQDGAAAAMLAVNMNSEQKAKAAIEADGYKDVRVLHRGSRNVWTAQALRGETYVTVSVDLSGNVSAN